MYESKSETNKMTASALNSSNKISCFSSLVMEPIIGWFTMIRWTTVSKGTYMLQHIQFPYIMTQIRVQMPPLEGNFLLSILNSHHPTNHSLCKFCFIAFVVLSIIWNIFLIFLPCALYVHINSPIRAPTQIHKTWIQIPKKQGIWFFTVTFHLE